MKLRTLNGLDYYRRMFCATSMSILFISACEAKPMTFNFDVTVFSYLNRPIFDIYVNGQLGTSTRPYPSTGGGTITGVPLPVGAQKVVWTLGGPEGKARNGEVVTAKNQPELKADGRYSRHLMVHIYPDDTVEFTFSERYTSQPSARGEIELEKMKNKNAQ